MGLLVDGQWHDQWYDTESTGGKFIRSDSQFRNWITADGSPGPSGEGGFKAEAGRYHLYVSYACPWASRVLIVRKLKDLEEFISLSVVNPIMKEKGWTFAPDEGVVADPIIQADHLYQIYTHVEADYTGRVTVPVLYDKKENKIVSNESAEIVRMLNSAFNHLTGNDLDLAPTPLLDEIEEVNAWVYDTVNNGVYKAGFATKQEVYEDEVNQLFASLDRLEDRLKDKDYLVGDQLTEADIRLFVTLVRFDYVYYSHFKCSHKRLSEYENLWLYTRKIYNSSGIADTVNFDHIKRHYYMSHDSINPTSIVPVGPDLNWSLD